ncbi:integumentary mucin C.1 isoform X2 [Drosophila novamexicana]|uniref:integumentary mucin C.1 isoform X2 n=1 Tax=Drosophila novamexicana TaxID=47314 RepID=UPI0011E5B1E0|nr:integumentary mucin C.1 isoform X2 [Drosophila novamexicana]
MNVLPVLLLLVQLTAMVLAGTNETATGSPASSNVTKLAMVSPSSKATAMDAGAGSSATVIAATVDKDKPAKVNGTEEHAVVLARGVTNTDTATVQATPKANATTTTTTTTTQAPQVIKSTAATAITKQTNTSAKSDKMLADGVSLSDINKNKKENNNSSSSSSTITTPAANINASASNSSSSSTTTTTTTSTTRSTTTTTSTTTMRPKKPTVTSSMDKQLEGEKLDAAATGAGNVAPHVLPVQELSSSLTNRGENEYIVPIVTIMLAVPLAIAVFIIMYRRFRDLWTTRHYRRMDFLVDGMYND